MGVCVCVCVCVCVVLFTVFSLERLCMTLSRRVGLLRS